MSIGQVMTIGACGIGPMIGGAAIQRFGIRMAFCGFFWVLIGLTLASFCVPLTCLVASRLRAIQPRFASRIRTLSPAAPMSQKANRANWENGPVGEPVNPSAF
jgi:hypothetical protein